MTPLQILEYAINYSTDQRRPIVTVGFLLGDDLTGTYHFIVGGTLCLN